MESVCFSGFVSFYLHSYLTRIDNLSETESGAACVTGGAVLLFFVLILEPPKMAC